MPIIRKDPPRPMEPDLRKRLVSQFARLLEADWRRRHADDKEPSAAPVDPAPGEPLPLRHRRRPR